MIGCAMVAGLAIVTARGRDPMLYPPDPAGPAVTVYVAFNSFHSSLTVPAAELLAGGGAAAEATQAEHRLKSGGWVSLGWGDAKFYQQDGMGPARIADFFRSMLWPNNPSVMHLVATADPTRDRSHPKILRLQLSRPGFQRLVARVNASFLQRQGRPVFASRGSGGDDLFFAGAGKASIVHDCNGWVGEALGAAGAPHTPVLDVAADGLALDLGLRAGAVRAR